MSLGKKEVLGKTEIYTMKFLPNLPLLYCFKDGQELHLYANSKLR